MGGLFFSSIYIYFLSYSSSSLKPCSDTMSYSSFLCSILGITRASTFMAAHRQSLYLRAHDQILDSTNFLPVLLINLWMNYSIACSSF